MISNHLSYLDIVVFASIAPCVFVAKAEMERWPLLGWMDDEGGDGVCAARARRKCEGGGWRDAGGGGARAAGGVFSGGNDLER